MGGSGVRHTSSALFGFEQAVGIDLSLERRPKRLPGGLGRLTRVVGRVESVCTDPAAKGPTGPLSLVHLQCFLVLTGGSDARRFDGLLLPFRVSEHSCGRRACPVSLAVPPEPRLGPGQEASRERSDSTPPTAGLQAYCVRY